MGQWMELWLREIVIHLTLSLIIFCLKKLNVDLSVVPSYSDLVQSH